MSLPPYDSSTSGLPPVPLEAVTARDLIDRYAVSKQTLYTRIASIGVSGVKRGKQVWFDDTDVYRLDAAHYFLGKGYGLKDLKEACGSFQSDSVSIGESVTSSLPSADVSSQTELVIAPQQEKVIMALTTAVQQALIATQPASPRDPLRSYRLLQESAEQQYQLTSQSLREIMEVSASTINSWGPVMSRNGFLLKKVGTGRWRVYREEDESSVA
jgi:DNA-binding transcriptional MerR regulator